MPSILSISGVSKTYATGFTALKEVNLDIQRGEIFALLGPERRRQDDADLDRLRHRQPLDRHRHRRRSRHRKDYRAARSLIGLVPQELTIDAFESVWATVNYSRGLFGKPANPAFVEKVLRDLSLWDKKDAKAITLSGGMKRRLMIAKALSHEPRILFLDEPTAGVDVELRQDMWAMVRRLREDGVTIILTTHYIEEAEAMADRVGVINRGEIILVENKAELMRKLGRKRLVLELRSPLTAIPGAFSRYALELSPDGGQLTYTYDNQAERPGVASLIRDLEDAGIQFRDIDTQNSSLEEIFVNLVRREP